MKLLPECVEKIPLALNDNLLLLKNRYVFSIVLLLVVVPTFALVLTQTDYALERYLGKLVQDGELVEAEARRLQQISRTGFLLLLSPWLLLGSNYLVLRQNVDSQSGIFDFLDTLKYVSQGWFFALIKLANRAFLLVLVFCIFGLINELAQSAWVETGTLILFSVILSLCIPKIALLFIWPWASTQLRLLRLRDYTVEYEQGVTSYLTLLTALFLGICWLVYLLVPEDIWLRNEIIVAIWALLLQPFLLHICQFLFYCCTILEKNKSKEKRQAKQKKKTNRK